MFFFGLGKLFQGMPSCQGRIYTNATHPLKESAGNQETYKLSALSIVVILIINAIAILSEDRFLARSKRPPPTAIAYPYSLGFPLLSCRNDDANYLIKVGWSRTQYDAGFGATHDNTSIKAKSADLIASVRTVMRSTSTYIPSWGICSNYSRYSPVNRYKYAGYIL